MSEHWLESKVHRLKRLQHNEANRRYYQKKQKRKKSDKTTKKDNTRLIETIATGVNALITAQEKPKEEKELTGLDGFR